MLLVGDIARSLLVLSPTTNIWGGAQSNVVSVHFVFLNETGSCSRYLEIS